MAHPRMIDAYVRELLDDAFDGDVETDGRRYRLPLAAQPVVEVVAAAGNALRVQVAAPVARDVSTGAELLAAVNDANARLPYGRMFVVDGTVVMEDSVLGAVLDDAVLDNAIHVVAWAVERFGQDLAAAGGGTPVVVDDPEAAPDSHAPGPGACDPGSDVEVGGDRTTDLLAGADAAAPNVTAVNAAGYL